MARVLRLKKGERRNIARDSGGNEQGGKRHENGQTDAAIDGSASDLPGVGARPEPQPIGVRPPGPGPAGSGRKPGGHAAEEGGIGSGPGPGGIGSGPGQAAARYRRRRVALRIGRLPARTGRSAEGSAGTERRIHQRGAPAPRAAERWRCGPARDGGSGREPGRPVESHAGGQGEPARHEPDAGIRLPGFGEVQQGPDRAWPGRGGSTRSSGGTRKSGV